ncbi:hypothetical protein O1M07_18865 [Streptomyces albulus]|nr:hypothetical protein [Streptomyces noursei]
MADRLPVAEQGVQRPAARAGLLHGRRGRDREAGQGEQFLGGGADLGAGQGAQHGGARRLRAGAAALPDQPGEPVQRLVEVALDVDVTGHPGPGQAQLARLEQQSAQRPAIADDEHRGVRGAGLAAVPGADPHRERGPQNLLGKVGEPSSGTGHVAHLRHDESGKEVSPTT